jgi:hypothetical protein
MKDSRFYDNAGVKYRFPERSCKKCNKYPCNKDIITLDVEFAKYGCIMYEQ